MRILLVFLSRQLAANRAVLDLPAGYVTNFIKSCDAKIGLLLAARGGYAGGLFRGNAKLAEKLYGNFLRLAEIH
jgi:hypothetical protein